MNLGTIQADMHRVSPEQPEIGAIYEHYKGKRYKILDIAFNADNCELAVVYESLYDDAQFGSHAHWVRSLKEFTGTLMVDGKERQRFKKVTATN